METKETISYVAVILAIIALFASIFAGCYAYFNQPEEVDLSGIAENRILINSFQDKLDDMEDDINDIPLAEVDEEDLKDLEDDIQDLENNIEDCAEDYPNNITKLTNCLEKL